MDSTCLLWKETCSGAGGRCLLYDIDMFRIKYVGIGAAVKVVEECNKQGLNNRFAFESFVLLGCGSLFLRFDLVVDGGEEGAG